MCLIVFVGRKQNVLCLYTVTTKVHVTKIMHCNNKITVLFVHKILIGDLDNRNLVSKMFCFGKQLFTLKTLSYVHLKPFQIVTSCSGYEVHSVFVINKYYITYAV